MRPSKIRSRCNFGHCLFNLHESTIMKGSKAAKAALALLLVLILIYLALAITIVVLSTAVSG